MGLLHEWFNLAPGPKWEFVESKQKKKFWYRWESNYSRVSIVYYGKFVGKINLVWNYEESVVELADILLMHEEHRQCGVGAKLMRQVKNLAQRQGVKAIVGQIVAREDRHVTYKYLQEWYQRQGFQVGPTGQLVMRLPTK